MLPPLFITGATSHSLHGFPFCAVDSPPGGAYGHLLSCRLILNFSCVLPLHRLPWLPGGIRGHLNLVVKDTIFFVCCELAKSWVEAVTIHILSKVWISPGKPLHWSEADWSFWPTLPYPGSGSVDLQSALPVCPPKQSSGFVCYVVRAAMMENTHFKRNSGWLPLPPFPTCFLTHSLS